MNWLSKSAETTGGGCADPGDSDSRVNNDSTRG
jgi:hypothetical protein